MKVLISMMVLLILTSCALELDPHYECFYSDPYEVSSSLEPTINGQKFEFSRTEDLKKQFKSLLNWGLEVEYTIYNWDLRLYAMADPNASYPIKIVDGSLSLSRDGEVLNSGSLQQVDGLFHEAKFEKPTTGDIASDPYVLKIEGVVNSTESSLFLLTETCAEVSASVKRL